MSLRCFLPVVFLLCCVASSNAQIKDPAVVRSVITAIIADASYGFNGFVASPVGAAGEQISLQSIPGTKENKVSVGEGSVRSQYTAVAGAGLNDEASRELSSAWRDYFLDSLYFNGGEMSVPAPESEKISVRNNDVDPFQVAIIRRKEASGWTVLLVMDTESGVAPKPVTAAREKAIADSLTARQDIEVYANSVRRLLNSRTDGFEKYRGRDMSGDQENLEIYASVEVQFPADSAAVEQIRIKSDTLVSYLVAIKGDQDVRKLVAAFKESVSDPALKRAGYRVAEISPGTSWRITQKGEEVAALVLKGGKATLTLKAVMKETEEAEDEAEEKAEE